MATRYTSGFWVGVGMVVGTLLGAARPAAAQTPALTSFSPASAPAGAVVTVTGTNLGGLTALSVGGVGVPGASLTNVSATGFRFVVPPGCPAPATTTATVALGTASSTAFTPLLQVAATAPAAAATAAPLTNSAVAVTFTEPVTTASVTTLASRIKVFSQQLGGRKIGTWTGGGTSTVQFTSNLSGARRDFRPGETVNVTVPPTVRSAGGLAATKRVYQFTTAVGGLGGGRFLPPATGAELALGGRLNGITLGDIDTDGDLDMLVSDVDAQTVRLRLNNGAGVFTAPITNANVAVAGGPWRVLLADFDGDGDLDFASANIISTSVSIRLNNGAGRFTGGSDFTLGSIQPYGLEAGDLDGDGDLDLAIASGNPHRVLTYINDGAAGFSAGVTLTAVSDVFDLKLGDIDADGDLDIVHTIRPFLVPQRLGVWKNDGNGQFAAAASVPIGNNPFSVALGDVDGDGDLDLAAANINGNSASIRLNDGTGAFSPAPLTPEIPLVTGPYTAQLVDVDADGDLDLLCTIAGLAPTLENRVSVRLNDGIGAFTAPASGAEIPVGTQPRMLATGDIDADGDLDFATACVTSGTVSVRLNQPLPPVLTGFSPARAAAGTTVTVTGQHLGGLTAFSVAGVSVPVASLTNASATSFSFVVPPLCRPATASSLTTPGGTASSTAFTPLLLVTATTPGANALAAPRPNSAVAVTFSELVRTAGVVNAATRIKVFSSRVGGLKAGTWTGGGTPTVQFASSLPGTRRAFTPGELVSVTVPNTILSGELIEATPRVYQFTTAVGGTGRGNFQPPAVNPTVNTGPGTRKARLADIDGDGDLDMIVTVLTNPAAITLRLNDGNGNFTGTTSFTVGNYPYGLVVGDVDADGDLDLVLTANATNTATVYRNNGSGAFSAGSSCPIGAGTFDATLGDADGDGDLDLFTCNNTGQTVSMRLNDGAGNFSVPPTGGETSIGLFASKVVLGDVDGDGDLDLLAVNNGTASVSVRLNDGAGRFAAPAIGAEVTVGASPIGIDIGDLDGDGDLDFVTANVGGNSLSVRRNDGTGRFTPPVVDPNPAAGVNPYELTLGDVDADGDLDVTVVSFSSQLTVFFNDGTGRLMPAPSPVALPGINQQNPELGDVDGDGDLDVVVPVSSTSRVYVYLNQPPPAITGFSPSAAVAGATVAVTGTNLGGLTALTVNGVVVPAASITNRTATGFSFVVPAGCTPIGTTTVVTGLGQGERTGFTALLRLTGTNPTRNARTAPVAGSTVSMTFTEPIAPAAAPNLRVFSGQVGGRKAGTVAVAGNTATYSSTLAAPRTDFRAGEVVSVTVPVTVQSAGGIKAEPRVYQFTTAVGGTGRGNFVAPALNPEPAAGSSPTGPRLGDVDGDGDLDLVVSNFYSSTLTVRLNDGRGSYGGGSTIGLPGAAFGLALGDIDADGDLDLVASNVVNGTVTRLLNNGLGQFTVPTVNPYPAVGQGVVWVELADVDADGDLDLLTANQQANTVSVRFNDGAGQFSGTTDRPVGARPARIVVADVDADGDLDFLTANNGTNTLSLGRNDGTGQFVVGAPLTLPGVPQSLAVGDVDADGDLDLLVSCSGGNVLVVRLNDGAGNFSGGSNSGGGVSNPDLAAGDLDADGDLDVVTTQTTSTLSVRLNDGTGTFGASRVVGAGAAPLGLVLGDIDGDQDLDLVAADGFASVSVRLNEPVVPVITALSAPAELVGLPLTLTGTGFTGATAVRFNGVAAPGFVVNSDRSLTVTVPVGASSGSITVTTPNGTATSPVGFTVLAVYSGPANQCLTTQPFTSTGDGAWHYLLAPNGQVVAALHDGGTALGAVQAEFTVATGAVRQDGAGRRYFDRNWHLLAQNAFAGQSVRVRFFGLNPELARLQAADPAISSLSALTVTQYAGANEDCILGNNDWATADVRLLLPNAPLQPADAGWFRTEVLVADHFSEFYLGGPNGPLPVELVDFAGTRQAPTVVRLTWQTASERQNRGFVVERSADGRTFDSISGLIAGHGTVSTPHAYTFTDESAPATLTYYRLRQIDEDGTVAYSAVAAVRGAPAGARTVLALAPNPARETLTVQPPTGAVDVQLLDMAGRVVLTAPVGGEGPVQLRLALPPGVYVVRSGAETARVVVE